MKKASSYLSKSNIHGEILVADNGSTDGSREIAQGLGARVISICERGYGAALIGGFGAARGRFVIIGDADDSYDFSQLDAFVAKLREGYDLVMGNRFKGGITQMDEQAMTRLRSSARAERRVWRKMSRHGQPTMLIRRTLGSREAPCCDGAPLVGCKNPSMPVLGGSTAGADSTIISCVTWS